MLGRKRRSSCRHHARGATEAPNAARQARICMDIKPNMSKSFGGDAGVVWLGWTPGSRRQRLVTRPEFPAQGNPRRPQPQQERGAACAL